jgi:hypothetical protein
VTEPLGTSNCATKMHIDFESAIKTPVSEIDIDSFRIFFHNIGTTDSPRLVKVKKVKFSPLQALEALRVVRG